jgi:hypothetical protein
MSKIVLVNYSVSEAFKIPKNINLEDKAVVKSWGVRWNVLHIYFVDGTEKRISSEGWSNDFDYKNPSDDPTIENADEYLFEDDEAKDDEAK